VDRVHGCSSPCSTSLIKPWLSTLGSMARIKNMKGYFLDLIYIVDHGADGGLISSLLPRHGRSRARGRHGCRWRRSSIMCYGALGKRKILPTRSRRARGVILLTFGKANGPRRASGGDLKFLVFDDSARPRLSFSGFKKQLQGFALIPSSFYLVQLLRTAAN
jgi:hypothetical protein